MLSDNLPSLHLYLGGFSPLEFLGWELLAQRHPHFIVKEIFQNSEHLNFHFNESEGFDAESSVLVLSASGGDFFMPETAEANRIHYGRVPTLVLAQPEPEFIYRIHRLDISGLIPLNACEEEIITSLHKLSRGEKYFAAPMVDALVAYTYQHSRSDTLAPKSRSFTAPQPLSIRELEILRLVVRGKSAKEIADELFLSVHTIYTHRKNILRKLACKNAAELVSYALDHGLLREIA